MTDLIYPKELRAFIYAIRYYRTNGELVNIAGYERLPDVNYAVIYLREAWKDAGGSMPPVYARLSYENALVEAWTMAERLSGRQLTATEILAIAYAMAEKEKEEHEHEHESTDLPN